MILQGNQRGGASDLARHLLKAENEHIEVYELRGFVADDLTGALKEAQAISKGTKAKQFLYSLSLNPPQSENVSTEAFEDAIARVEKKLGLEGQPRAIVFHKKKGRRHAHAVWSRTNTQTMTAVHLPHTKRKLMEISRELYIEHGWEMPQGMLNPELADSKNFTLAQWQQAKRIGKDPRAIKQAFQDSWAISDNLSSFTHALEERGFILAKGDRRGFVAIDNKCEVYAVAKWVGVKTKEVKAKLGDEKQLQTVTEVKAQISTDMQQKLSSLRDQQNQSVETRITEVRSKFESITFKHKQERQVLEKNHAERSRHELHTRKARYRKGLRGLFDRFTGRHKQIREQNELELTASQQRDRREKDDLIYRQLEERRNHQKRIERLQCFQQEKRHAIDLDIDQYREINEGRQEAFDISRTPKPTL